MDTKKLLEIMKAISEKIEAEKDVLTELDSAIGDGDHGINMARGAVVDPQTVYEAIESNRIMGFATDVFESEPPLATDPLLKIADHPRVIYTPHVAWASEYAQDKLWRILKRQVEEFIVKYKAEHKQNEKA